MEAAIFEDLTALGDATRSRMLLLLERHELTVGELCAVLQLPQSTVSRHLKTLADASWVSSRRDGTSRYYTLALDERDDQSRRLWTLLRDEVRATPGADQDARRLKTVLNTRQTKSQEFFESAAAQWDKLRQDLFGRDVALQALPGTSRSRLGRRRSRVWHRGAQRVDCRRSWRGSSRSIDRARCCALPSAGCGRCRTWTFAKGSSKPCRSRAPSSTPPRSFSSSTTFRNRPRRLREAGRVLKPGGRLMVADMLPHDREEYRQQMGHVWLGFGEEAMHKMLATAGFEAIRFVPLAVDSEAKGPALFVAAGNKKG